MYERAKKRLRNANSNKIQMILLHKLKKILRIIYYTPIWLYLMLLVVLFMLPFMKVAKPTAQITTSNNTNGKCSNGKVKNNGVHDCNGYRNGKMINK